MVTRHESPCYITIGVRLRIQATPENSCLMNTAKETRSFVIISKPCYIPLARLCTSQNLAQSSKFLGKNFFGTKVTSEAFLSIAQNRKVTRLLRGTQTKLWTCWRNFDLSRSFERFFWGVRSWLRCAPVDDLTKNVVNRMCSPSNELSNKTNVSSLNPFSCMIQIFKVRVKVSYFLGNFENLQRFFTGEVWPWRPWTWCL